MMLRITSFICFTFLSLFALTASALQKGRTLVSLNDQWAFHKEGGPSQLVNLPHTWNAADVMDDVPGYYRGVGIYTRQLKSDASWKGKKLFLIFNGVAQECEVLINGKSAGAHFGSYNRFIVPISGLLNFKDDKLAVRVTNRFNENIPPLTADFTFFGGIYRNVDLLITEQVHFSQNQDGSSGLFVSTPGVSTKAGKVSVQGFLDNQSPALRALKIRTVIADAKGEVLSTTERSITLKSGESRAVDLALKDIKNPKLWSPDHPYLYRVISRIIDARNGEVLDELSSPLGMRWFRFDAQQGFYLNGKSLKLIGTSRHQDYEHLGNALPDALHIRDVELLKEMGGNFLRVAHYPQDRSILEACDRLGILASVEIPVVNTITETAEFTRNCLQMQTEMIRQHFNHPSVIIWAYMNEVLLRPKFTNDKARQQIYFVHIRELAEKLESLTRKLDPARYTLLVNHGAWDLYNKVGLTKIPMIVGWNLYSGWYSGNITDFDRFLDRHRRELPDKPMMVTEYGADADPRISSFTPERFDKSVEYALGYHQHYLNAMLARPFVAGAVAWNLADFSSETRAESMPHINNKGLLTIGRKAKDTYFLYQAYLSRTPYLKLLGTMWNNRFGVEDSSRREVSVRLVQVATNLDSARLFLNGLPLGQSMAMDHLISWQVPFVKGRNKLSVVSGEVRDEMEVSFQLQPYDFTSGSLIFQDMNVLLGARRYYHDPELNQLWIPEQPYRKNSWGYIGGEVYKGNNNREPYGSDKDILGSENDPVYQTQRQGLKSFRFDAPDGEYEICLHFAELVGGAKKEALAYNLTNNDLTEVSGRREFDVSINGKVFLCGFDLAREHGYASAVEKKTRISVNGGLGIEVAFRPIAGMPVLNAIQIRKIY